jgi:hypothetical protein
LLLPKQLLAPVICEITPWKSAFPKRKWSEANETYIPTYKGVQHTMKKIVIIDGQGGRLGQLLVEMIKNREFVCEVYAIGTNSIATSAMIKAGADYGATGENPVIVACRDADVIIGPVGIVSADSMLGEVTPAMAVAVGQSRAVRLLLPVNRCNTRIVGVQSLTMTELVKETAEHLKELL